jgi:hypothetical protein
VEGVHGNAHTGLGVSGRRRRVQNGVEAWPIGGLGSSGRLVELGGGEWGLVV